MQVGACAKLCNLEELKDSIDHGESLQLRVLEGCQACLSLSLSLGRFISCRLGATSSLSSPDVFVPSSSTKKLHRLKLNFRRRLQTMRLLQRKHGGRYSLTEFVGDAIPPYAILSHTWGPDQEEVTFADLEQDAGTTKAGYRKLQFCADQAAKDGLRYFWVDTCCIDKSSSAELSEAINSMFAWYRDAARCYVYLSDVSTSSLTSSLTSSTPAQQHWNRAFQQSRWFTRGWTLQELVAPVSVEFFSAEGERLGNKYSLVQELHSVTGISSEALQGSRPLDQLSVDERMSWVGQRKTKREEDAAYSLLGIFDVHMPLIYGEGRRKAFARLQREIDRASSDTHSTLPQDDVPQSRGYATHAYNGPVFYGPISGRYVVTGTHVTGGTVNFDFREGRDVSH